MSIPRLSMRVVLSLLAADAVFCIIRILAGGFDATAEVIVCSIVTAVVATIVLLMGRLAANEDWRLLALTAAGFALGELLLTYALCATDIVESSPIQRRQLETALADLARFGLLLAFPMMLAMRLWRLPNFRITSRIIVYCDGVALLLCIAAAASDRLPIANVLWPVAVTLVVLSVMVGLAFGRGGILNPLASPLRGASVIAGLAAVTLAALSGARSRGWEWRYLFGSQPE